MAILACLWCETTLRPGTANCPECGLQCPTDDAGSGAAAVSKSSVRRSPRMALAFIAVPVMLSAAYAAHMGNFPHLPVIVTRPAQVRVANPLQPPAVYSDPLQRSVWISGVKAVEHALAQPGYAGFSGSYIDVAAGHVVSFCGEVAGTSGYNNANGARRFISIFGQVQSTILESDDASFGVLWTRVCAQDESAA